MSVFKCKMCGGTIEFEQGATVGTCDSCGTKQTLPKLDDEKKANLYDRANHFRRNNDFDKAMGIYETILNEDKSDAEAYWSIVLCKYGIEYVEDPSTHKRVPTVNRTQFASVMADEDYKSALEYATIEQKIIYEKEAKAIDEIQKGILEISNKEEPFDVFICYKETDNNGRRTPDSVLANDLYHQLTQEGFKVFFSRITLEDKLGQEYEPYIFAALNSAKVMVVIGTKPEYFNAVWVKNEWSRYLAVIKGTKKVLIPAYKDMDPYDLPEEFSHLQAQDMSKLGFMQDLIRGIKKLANIEKPKTTVKETVIVNNAASAEVTPLIKRIFLFLEDGEWEKADEYCERVLDKDPENALAYLGKLMVNLKVKKREALKKCSEPFNNNKYFSKASRFSAEIAKELETANEFIIKRNEETRKQKIYNDAVDKMQKAHTDSDFKAAADVFTRIKGYKDADELLQKCMEGEETAKKEATYEAALFRMDRAETESEFQEAARIFGTIKGYRDSDELAEKCSKNAETIRKTPIYKNARNRIVFANTEKDFKEAADLFEAIRGFKDSEKLAEICYAILNAYHSSETVKKAFERYSKKEEKIIIHPASWLKKLFGGQDEKECVKTEVQKFIKLDAPVGTVVMTEGLCNEMTIYEAFAYMVMLNSNNFGGFSDWSIPSANDVEALKKSSKIKNYEADKSFWNRTSITQDFNPSDRNRVCCVSCYNYINHGDYIELVKPIKDSLGNEVVRMIQRGFSERELTWQEGMDYAKQLQLGGYSDWRVPTKKELEEIYKFKGISGINPAEHYFWSSSTNVNNTNYAWAVNFSNGYVNYSNKTNYDYVRCVR